MINKILKKFGSIKKIRFYYQRSITDFRVRNRISNNLATKIGTSNFSGSSIITSKALSNSLNTSGFIDFGKVLDDNKVTSIISALNKLKCFDPFRPSYGMFSVDKIPNDVHVANFKRSDLVAIPEIMNIANDPLILETVQGFLGATPTISNINCWWSIAGKEQAEQAQLFHRDVDDYKFCKLFIYLTDVQIEDGPHVYVKNSFSSNTLTKIRRYEDSEIENEFGKENIKYFTAEKGSMFLVNTYGFHKGFLPEKNNRLLLQVQYSLNPIGIETYKPIRIDYNDYNKYVNRLIIK